MSFAVKYVRRDIVWLCNINLEGLPNEGDVCRGVPTVRKVNFSTHMLTRVKYSVSHQINFF